jgi:glucose-1-phosphate thymidylyltransferase
VSALSPLHQGMGHELIGLVPAAGSASRVGPLPCSKEVWPVGFQQRPRVRPIVAAEYLLGGMVEAGVARAYVVLRRGKWDIPAQFSERSCPRPELAFLTTEGTAGVPFTIDHAYPWVRGRTVVFGFPDIIFRPSGVYSALLDRLRSAGSDVVLSLFPATNPAKMDMVEVGAEGRVRDIVIKPDRTALDLTWIHCVWRTAFTDFLHDFVAGQATADTEIHVGDVIRAAISAGMSVTGVIVEGGEYLDIGTPEDLMRAEATTRMWHTP